MAIVVPVYRNATTIGALSRRLQLALHDEDYGLLFVVDACPGESWAEVRRIAHEDPHVSGVLLARNVGQHAAIMVGLSAVRARWYVVMDADLQDRPEAVPVLIGRARETGSTVFVRRSGRYESAGRMATSRAFKTLLRWMTGLPSEVGTFFVVPAAVADAMRGVAVRSPQAVVLAHHCSHRWTSVTVERAARSDGRSAYSGRDRVRAAARALRCALECRRQTGRSDAAAVGPTVAARVNV